MKTVIGFSSLVSFIFCLTLQTSVTSCTKEVTAYDTITITKTDTLIKTDTLVITDSTVTAELLTANSWKTDEIIGVNGNFRLFYQRGGSDNTENYDSEYITFKTDGTGIFFDAAKYTHAITWHYLDSAYTQLTFDVFNPYPIATQTVTWDNLRYKNGLLKLDQYWTYSGANSHAQIVRSPK